MKRILVFSLCAATLLLAGCKKEPFLTLSSPASLDVNVDGGSGSITFTSNTDWTASSSESWVSLSPSSGTASDGPITVTVKCNANTTYEDRGAVVTIRGEGLTQSVTVRQPANLGLILPNKSYDLASDARTIDVEVQANVDYTVSVSEKWIKQTGTKGLKSKTLSFSVEENSTYDARSATITVKPQTPGVQEQVISVKQAQKDALIVKDSSYNMPYGGGEVDVKVESNVSFEVKSGADWIQYVQTKALSSSTVVLKVAENTTFKAREGKVEIAQKGGSLSHTVTIKQAGRVAVTGVTLNKSSLELQVGASETLVATVKPDNATDKSVSWNSDKPAVATVDAGGKVTAVAEGTATVTAKAGDKSAACTVSVKPNEEGRIKSALKKIYDTMGGAQWNIQNKWDTGKDLDSWEGVRWNSATRELKLDFNEKFVLKGEFPDCFADLTSCVHFWVQNQSGLTGKLPPSFNKLRNLKSLVIEFTSMTSLPDVFGGMPLGHVSVSSNELMTGPLPESLGQSDGLLANEKIEGTYETGLYIVGNGFTGALPQSWLRLGTRLNINAHRLDGQIPDYFYSSDDPGYWINMYINQGTPLEDEEFRKQHPFSVKDRDIPGYWPKHGLKDVITGKQIPYNEIISKNKVTVVYRWGSWCNYSASLLPQLKRMHEKYHDAGLEVIVYTAWGDSEGNRTQKDYVLKNGYERWYNASSDELSMAEEAGIGSGSMPFVNVIDNKGNIVFSCSKNVSDPSRNRFGHIAYFDLIPFLEDIFGPMEDGNEYVSTDYSKDGTVITLQTASVGKGINVVFLGDAYTDKDIDDGTYDWMMKESMEALFAIEPYKSFRNRFNVYFVRVVSKNGRTGGTHSTALGSVISNGTTISGSTDKCFEYALKVPGIKNTKNLLVGVLVNSIYHGGIAVMSESLQSGVAFYSSVGNDKTLFGPTLRHEAGGHGFAFLADEYSTQDASVGNDYIAESNRLYKQYGWHANIDFTKDPAKVKWSAFLTDDRYKDEAGVYEGAANCTKGAWRPSADSMMNQNIEFFNAPSRWAIYQRIMKLSGEEASFAKFLEYDAVNRGSTKAGVPVPLRRPDGWEPGAPPVIVP